MKKHFWYLIGILLIAAGAMVFAIYTLFQMKKAVEEMEQDDLNNLEAYARKVAEGTNVNTNGHVTENTTIKAENPGA